MVYFELNNWFAEEFYPNIEPFISWMSDDSFNQYFNNEKWVKENKICVVFTIIDMSCNYCITAPEDWVLKNCPDLLNKYIKFLRFPDENGIVYGQFGTKFLKYTKENIGIKEEEF